MPPRWFTWAWFALAIPVALFAATGSKPEFSAIVFLPLAGLIGYWLVAGLRSGVMWTRGGTAPRASAPFTYWLHVALAVVLVALCVAMSIPSLLA